MKYLVTAIGLGQQNKTEVCSTLENARRVAEKYCADLNSSVALAEVICIYDRETKCRSVSKTGAEQ